MYYTVTVADDIEYRIRQTLSENAYNVEQLWIERRLSMHSKNDFASPACFLYLLCYIFSRFCFHEVPRLGTVFTHSPQTAELTT